MHIAAQLGRRDVIEYLLSLEGGREALQQHDQHGRTALWYAQHHQHSALEHWLHEEGLTQPIRVQEQRPSVHGLDEKYIALLHQIESSGWKSVKWNNGFTMLHSAANKGHLEL